MPIPCIRVFFRAVPDSSSQASTYVTKALDLSTNIDQIVKFVEQVQQTGGGDTPEAYELALREARKLSWSPQAGNKALVIIGDAPPHAPSYTDQKIWWREEVRLLKEYASLFF